MESQAKIDRVQGANVQALEAKIQALVGTDDGESGEDFGQGLVSLYLLVHFDQQLHRNAFLQMDLNVFIEKKQCECLNEADDHPLEHSLTSNGGYLESDCDEQLILSISFNQAVKIHSLKLKAPEKLGPKNMKLFINQPRTIDFDQAESALPVQDLVLDAKDLAGQPVNLRYVKFQNVQNIQIFIKDNQGGGDVTQLDYIGFIGSPIATTKMEDFKRIGGKKGESH